ncbi:2Fe-2S ferredoxin-type domain-containing protein [Lenzites betulinus]|nr:2Fe-2S ferredoxin-type domain-containing protein [Lenzites betulinus]
MANLAQSFVRSSLRASSSARSARAPRSHAAQASCSYSSYTRAATPSRLVSRSRTTLASAPAEWAKPPVNRPVGRPARRGFHTTSIARHGGIERPEPGTGIKIHFKDAKGNLIRTVEANEGDDILGIAHEYDIDLEGACEGSVACSTCHVILDPESYDKLPEPEDDENDMLDMAFGLTDTSRLGCQVRLTKDLDGITATLPAATRNMFVDGKKPTHH